VTRGLDVSVDVQSPVSDLRAERQRAHDPGLAHSRQAAHGFEQDPVEADDLFGPGIGRLGRGELERQDLLRIEAEIHPRECGESAEHQSRSEQQHDRERHLCRREHAPQPMPPHAR
jgi:hypothetical protein